MGSGDGSSSGSGSEGGDAEAVDSGETNANTDPDATCEPPAQLSGTNGQANLQTGNLTLGAGGGSCSSDDRLLPSSRSSENPHPIISVRYTLPAGQPVPDQITAQLTFGGLQGPKVFYNTAGLQPGEELRFVLQADASTLPTGRYAWEMAVTTGTGPGAQQHVFDGHREVFNRVDSEFGNRLWIDDLDRLIVYPDGVSLIRGDGTAGWFRKDSNGELVTPLGSLSSLQENQDGSFTLLRRWGHWAKLCRCERAASSTQHIKLRDARTEGGLFHLRSVGSPQAARHIKATGYPSSLAPVGLARPTRARDAPAGRVAEAS